MATFQYEAMNQAGQEVKDEIDAQTTEDALAKIRSLPRAVAVEAERLAREAGDAQTMNTVMVGACSHLLPMKPELLEQSVGKMFGHKGEDVLRMNLTAFRAGHAAAVEAPGAATPR